jgi:two-component system sensor histidine kinase KdpD
VVALCTSLCAILFRRVSESNLVLIFLVGVVFVATRFGKGPSILAAVLGVLSFDFFFVAPTLSFAIQDTQYLLTFVVMLLVAVVVSTLAVGAKRHAEAEVQVEAEQLRNTLLSAISHDLRTPLASIKGAASLLVQSPGLDPEVRLDLLTSIHNEADYINRMVTNLLDLTRLEGGGVTLKKEPVALDEVVGTVTDLLEKGLRQHPLRIEIPSDLPAIPADAVLIQQVLFNLVNNAVQHTPAGAAIDLAARVEGAGVTVEVADRGPGIPAGDEKRIFDKYQRGTAGGKRTGVGLGLTLCEAILRLHGGRIWAENRPGGGAVFRFTVPMEGAATRAAQAAGGGVT